MTDLAATEVLVNQFRDRLHLETTVLVSASGLFTRSELDRVQAAGAEAVLVGEALMRQEDVETALHALVGA